MTKPDCICSLEELADPTIWPEGWVMLCRNVDGVDGVGIKYLGGLDPLARIEALENVVAAKQNIIKIIQGIVNDHLDADAALAKEKP